MASDDMPPAASDVVMEKPAEASGSGDSKPAPAASEPSRAGDKRKGGDMGRAESSRQPRGDKRNKNKDVKEKKPEVWRDYKRRKIHDAGEPSTDKQNPFSKEEIAAEERRPKRKVAVMIGYAGTGYKGMQLNGEEKTIERDIFRAFVEAGAISKANADDPRKSSLARCARTDKGVHAAGNVISLKLIIEDEDVVEKINTALPPQIRIWGIQRTNNIFNCYQLCDSRWYEYLLPSYCLLPPHPATFLGKKVVELAKEYGVEEEVAAKMADVKGFWEEVEEKEIKPLLAKLDPEVRAAVLDRLHAAEETFAEDGAPEKTAEDAPAEEATSTEPAAEAPGKVKLETVSSRHRELTPVDFALRDIKAVYVSAKRRYRVTPARLGMLQAVLDAYSGTRNFHNYTVQKAFTDASAKRHIKSFIANPKPIIIGNTEWLSLKVHGQSFMMHQIRKMVGLASLMVRCATPIDLVKESYGSKKMAIPKAPGLGLLLQHPVFVNYNRRATESLNKPEINFDNYDEKMNKFKQEQIYTRIFDVEEKENSFHSFFNQIDQFKSSAFLWVTAGGLDVAEINSSGGDVPQNVDKQLGDEDEDPEGGEG